MRLFVYLHSDDLVASRSFYTGVLGLTEIFNDEAVVGYVIGETQLTIEQARTQLGRRGWAKQLGWVGGHEAVTSLGFEVDGDDFVAIVERCATDAVEARFEAPKWVGYWSYPVRDPMGNTIEVSTSAEGAWGLP